jgi:hypothetical protein
MPVGLEKSRFSRRLPRIKPWFLTLFAVLGEHFKEMNAESVYVLDTFPIAACDKAYTHYEFEDGLSEADLHLLPMRKHNSKRLLPSWMCYLQAHLRKAVETTRGLLECLFPKSIHAVTTEGFELKLVLFVLALSISRASVTN